MSNRLIINTAKLQADVGKDLVTAGKALIAAGKKYAKISHEKEVYTTKYTSHGYKIPKNKQKRSSKKSR